MATNNKYLIAFYICFFAQIAFTQNPQLFAAKLNTEKVEYGFTITPDEKTAYFVKTDSFYILKPKNIYKSKLENGKWSEPKLASFSGTGSDSSPFVSPDGKKLFFTSKRDVGGKKVSSGNIWYVELHNGKESNPIYVKNVNSKESEYSPTTDVKGNLYFGSYREGGYGSGDIWMSKYEKGHYQKPINLGEKINSRYGEWGSCIAPDGSFLIFENSGKSENLSAAGDFYISYFENNQWTTPFHYNAPINSIGSDLAPKIHGSQFYFASNRASEANSSLNNVDFYKIPLNELLKSTKTKSEIKFKTRDFLIHDKQTSAGVSWADINNDGFIDLIIANAQKQNNKIYINQKGKGFKPKEIDNITNDESSTSAIAFADFDNDGDQDVLMGNQHGEDNFLYENIDGNYKLIQKFEAGDTYHANWIDYNNDGFLDCFIPNAQTGITQLYEQKNKIFNPLINVISELKGFHSGTSWLDLNNDNYQDLYIPIAGASDEFFKYNKAIKNFVSDNTILGGTIDHKNFTAGVSFGDYDNDGDLDGFLANLNNQKNVLLENKNGVFQSSVNGLLDDELSSWVGLWGDYDNDGDLDLYVSNYDQPNSFFENQNGRFQKIELAGITDTVFLTSGAAWADYNKDGFLDIVLANWEKTSNTFLEGVPNSNQWIGLRLQGLSSNKDAIGTKVKISYKNKQGSKIQYREIQSNMGLRSYPERIAHFGLGKNAEELTIEINWPSGKKQKFILAKLNAYYSIKEDNSKPQKL